MSALTEPARPLNHTWFSHRADGTSPHACVWCARDCAKGAAADLLGWLKLARKNGDGKLDDAIIRVTTVLRDLERLAP